MSNVEHTPGPWRAFFNGTFWEIRTLDDEFGGIGDVCASSASAPNYGRSLGLAEANARLIAAAPELLAACKACLLREDIADGELGEMLRYAVKKARAA